MLKEKELNLMSYILGSVILASISFNIIFKYKWLALIIASCFFIFIYYKSSLFITFITILIFLVSITNNIFYYKYIPNNIEEIKVTSLNFYGGIGEVQGRKVYLAGKIKNLNIGEKILVTGEFEKNTKITKGIIGNYKINTIEKKFEGISRKLYKIREDIFYKIKEKLGWRRGSLVSSIAFGYTEFLDIEDKNEMKNLGVLHAIAVSGMHMALVYLVLKKIFGSKLAPFIAFFYVIFTGASVSTIRAYIMLLCTSMAMPLKRNYNPISSLSLAGTILIFMKPYCIFEVGFQLTFMATLGIILFNKALNKKLYKLPKYIRESLSICISAQIFTLPVLIIYFKEFSLGFILGNLVISPIISLIIILGNLLVLTFKIPFIFNYLCFIVHYCTVLIDIFTNWIMNIMPEIIYVNESLAFLYLSIIMAYYFYKKGYKKFIYFPYIMLIYVIIVIYSPIPKIEYYKDGGILLSYRGDRVLVKTKSKANLEKLERISLATNTYKEIEKIKINKYINIKKSGKDFILNTNGKLYSLKVSSFEKKEDEYDIIDFNNGSFDKILILKNKVLRLD
ncbi:ComEC/Rec2 family competence protein [Clostridium carnis]